MKVKCRNVIPIDKEDPTYPNLTLENIYSVIDEGSKLDYRIINNEGEPCLYDTRRFDIVDNTMDDDWIVKIDDEGSLVYFYSKELSQYEHLYEDYHDDNLEAIKAFDAYVIRKFKKEHGEPERIIHHPLQLKPQKFVEHILKEYSKEELRDVARQANKRYANVTIMDVRCLNSQPMDRNTTRHPDITEGNVYSVLGSEGDFYRIIGDSGKPYLYHKNRFKLVGFEKGQDWISEINSAVGEIWYPPGLTPKVFEKFISYDFKAREEISVYAHNIYQKKLGEIYDETLSMKGPPAP